MTLFMQYSGGCLLVGIALTISQILGSDPQQPAAHRESAVRFKSQDGTFAIEYPNSLISCERDPKHSDQWIPTRSCEAYTPVCTDAAFTKDATVVCIAYLAENLSGTNFEAAWPSPLTSSMHSLRKSVCTLPSRTPQLPAMRKSTE